MIKKNVKKRKGKKKKIKNCTVMQAKGKSDKNKCEWIL